MDTFDIYFLGETLPDADPATVRSGVAGLFRIQEDAADRLFSGRPLRVKQDLDAEKASRYRAAFREVGALLQIVPHGAPPPAPKPPAAQAAAPAAPTAPAASGPADSADAPGVPGAADDVTLAEPGATIDLTEPAPPAEIDTGNLEALPPNTGSLEDCRVEKPARPIPDISHMQLIDD